MEVAGIGDLGISQLAFIILTFFIVDSALQTSGGPKSKFRRLFRLWGLLFVFARVGVFVIGYLG